jgi:D-alanyl-lipoteichoic acid acyltransferase DltB (MBOAT superfamily)
VIALERTAADWPFNSFTFLGFFLCVLLVHSLPLPWIARKFNLLFASYLLYAAWDVRFPLLLLFATVTNWLAASLIVMWDQFPRRRRIVIWLDVVLNIGLHCMFKYGNEFLSAWQWLADHLSPDVFRYRNMLRGIGELSLFPLLRTCLQMGVFRASRRDIKLIMAM